MGRLNGVFNILKPPGISSHGVVKFIRKNLKDTKVGHGGTLDPGAAGVLPVLVGRATKLSAFLLDYDKSYRGEVFLGKTTTTDDSAGEVLSDLPVPVIDEQSLKRILKSVVGKVEQIPPLFSALKHKGKKYLDYARKGENITPKPRTAQIYKCELVKFTPPNRVMLDVYCSKGTYIRSLARDLGEKIGCGAHLSFLVRKSTGPFKIENSLTLEEFMEAAKKGLLSTVINSPDACLPHFKNITLEGKELQSLLNGVKYKLTLSSLETGFCSPGEYFKVYNKNGGCVALGQLVQDTNTVYLKPVVILSEK